MQNQAGNFKDYRNNVTQKCCWGRTIIRWLTVKLIFCPDRQKMSQRLSISEHPFGTIKRWMDAGYYLLCGKRKVDGETALMCLGYNLVRAVNLLGFKKMMEIMA